MSTARSRDPATVSGPFASPPVTLRVPELIRTERLTGSRIDPADLDDFRSYYGDAAVMRRLSPFGRPYTPEAAARLFEGHMRHWEEHGYGTWMFRDREGRFVGRGGLRCFEVAGSLEVEVFYGVASDRWAEGYGTEMARAVVDAAFEHLRPSRVVAFTLPTNEASLRILEKCGFRKVGTLTHAGLEYGHFRLNRTAH